MLESIRVFSRTWPAKFIFVLVAFSFIFFGIGSLSLLSNQSNVLVEVNKESISKIDFQRQFQADKQRFSELLGDIDPSQAEQWMNQFVKPEQVLTKLVDRSLLSQWIVENRLLASKIALIDYLKQVPQLVNESGDFDEVAFLKIADRLAYSPELFLNTLQKDLSLQTIFDTFAKHSIVFDAQVDHYMNLLAHQKEVISITIDHKDLSIDVLAEEIELAYERDQTLWFDEASMDVNYLLLSQSSIKDELSVTEQEIKDFYQQKLDQALSIKKVYHIQVSKDDRELLLSIVEQLKLKTLQFEDAVKKYSVDKGSIKLGGFIGKLSKEDSLFDAKMQAAAERLGEGQISDIIATEYGLHILTIRSENNVLPFDRIKIRDSLLAEKRSDIFSERKKQLEELKDLYDDDFEALSDEIQLPIQLASNLSLQREVPAPFSKAFVQRLFESKSFQQSYYETLLLPNGDVIIANLKQLNPKVKKPLEEVNSLVKQFVFNEKLNQRQANVVDKIKKKTKDSFHIKAIHDFLDRENIAFSENRSWVSEMYESEKNELPVNLLQVVFSQIVPMDQENRELFHLTLNNKIILYTISSIKPLSLESISEARLNQLRDAYRKRMLELELSSLMQYLKQKASIKYVNSVSEEMSSSL